MTRKLALIALLATLTFGALAACGDNGDSGDVRNDPDVQQTIDAVRQYGDDKPEAELEAQIEEIVDHAAKLDDTERASYLELVRTMAQSARESRDLNSN